MTRPGVYLDRSDCDLAAFEALIAQPLLPEAVPRAAEVLGKVPVYDMAECGADLEDPVARRGLLAEWAWVLGDGPGVFVQRAAVPEPEVIDAVTALYLRVIEQERAAGAGGADHFAASGANDRIWNSLQKLCLAEPALFVRYFGAPAIAGAAEAWLGPGFQMTAQVNLVRPGGAAQEAHRDYHLGFQTEESALRYPVHVHTLSPYLTLQGGIAHGPTPVESGPTQLLPWSQQFAAGYLAYRDPAFRAVFEASCVQIPLEKGDALFFNPALFHAAGANRSPDIQRLVNLMQVSSAFGRAMEALDRDAMARAVYPHLQRMAAEGQLRPAQVAAAIACSAEGYPFPSNLDTDPPRGGLAPESQAALMTRALAEGQSPEAFAAALDAHGARRAP
ncbi:phytanoyl-CoA dioxygenase family protein [Dinoroseobacter sp. S124A]|uniref:phytanoyl-CoA dioxygenase family protein n=1 Tax=Dinoroseobacter sp. S124A TaxID=3415128 RepID=UPI003C7B23F5